VFRGRKTIATGPRLTKHAASVMLFSMPSPEKEMIDFIANRTDPGTTERIVKALDDPNSFETRFIDEFRDSVRHAAKRVDWRALMQDDEAQL
jgi:hypothetical protein